MAYKVAFGVKGDWAPSSEFSCGWVNLVGSRAYLAADSESTSLQE